MINTGSRALIHPQLVEICNRTYKDIVQANNQFSSYQEF